MTQILEITCQCEPFWCLKCLWSLCAQRNNGFSLCRAGEYILTTQLQVSFTCFVDDLAPQHLPAATFQNLFLLKTQWQAQRKPVSTVKIKIMSSFYEIDQKQYQKSLYYTSELKQEKTKRPKLLALRQSTVSSVIFVTEYFLTSKIHLHVSKCHGENDLMGCCVMVFSWRRYPCHTPRWGAFTSLFLESPEEASSTTIMFTAIIDI